MTAQALRLGTIKVQGASERIVREAAPPHHREVLKRAHGLMDEIEEALGMTSLQKKAAVALLARSYELNRVLLGESLVKVERDSSKGEAA